MSACSPSLSSDTVMSLKRFMPRLLAIALLSTLLAGCAQSQPTNFYTLFAFADQQGVDEGDPLRLGVEQVRLPAYLDRPQIVTRNGTNRMTVADLDQWAEPLETTFQRVLRENLSSRLASDLVVTLPSRRDLRLDRQIEVEVLRFDADETGQVVLDASWLIFDGNGRKVLDEGRSLIRQQVTRLGDYEQIAKAMSVCLAGMSDEIADAIEER